MFSCHQMVSGIKNAVFSCGCDMFEACLDVNIKANTTTEKISRCGKTLSSKYVSGYEVSIKSTDKLQFDMTAGCFVSCNFSVMSKQGDSYANFNDSIITYLGSTPSNGIWFHEYHLAASDMTISNGPILGSVTLESNGCYLSLASDCEIKTGLVTVTSDNGTIDLIINITGDVIDTSGNNYGHYSAFTLPFSSFTMSGTINNGSLSSYFSLSSTSECSTSSFSLNGPSSIDILALSNASYSVVYYGPAGEVTTYHTGNSSASFPSSGIVNVSGCGVTGYALHGDVSSASLSECVTSFDSSDSNLGVVTGGSVTYYNGNGTTLPLCEWPLITYVDAFLTGTIDITCYTVLEEADFSGSTIDGIVGGNASLLRLDVSNNGNADDSTIDFCQFPNLYLFAANYTSFNTIDITCCPTLRELYLNGNVIFSNGITTGGTHQLERLELNNCLITQIHYFFTLNRFPNLRVLHWSYFSNNDFLVMANHPLLEEFYCASGDPNPFFFQFTPTDYANIRDFTYINGVSNPNWINLIVFRLVAGGMANCNIVIDTGNAAPNASACGHISTLISNGCTVAYTSGGAC